MPQKHANPFGLFSVPILCLQKRVAIGIDAFKTEFLILVTGLALNSLKLEYSYFFRDSIRMLPDRWTKVIENSGQYFEN